MNITGNFDATVAKMTREEAKILAHFAAGESLDEIAASTRLPRGEVSLTVETLAKNSRNLAQNLTMAWQRNNPPAVNGHTPPPPVVRVASPPAPAADTIADLLTRAADSGMPRLVRLANKIQDYVDELTELLADHERGRALREEAQKLERRLTEIRGLLNPKRASTTPPSEAGVVDNKTVREWAAANGVECPSRGRIPSAVLDVYREKTREN